MDTNTCLIERSAVRELLITAIDVNADVTGDLLAEIDKLPIVTLADAEAAAERLRGLVDRLKLEAQCHSGEARAANHTIAEAYQAVTGGKGEPGRWNGAEPIRTEIGQLRVLLARCLKSVEGGKWRDSAGLSAEAHPVWDDVREKLRLNG